MRAIVCNYQTRPVLAADRLAAMAETVRLHEDAPRGAFGVAYVDDTTMAQHHGQFLGNFETTDVLSFPNELELAAGVATSAEAVTDDPEPYWGDVIVCTDAAARQARDFGHPYLFELALLVVHGTLHLLGHDHTRDQGEMNRLEQRLRCRCWAAVSRG